MLISACPEAGVKHSVNIIDLYFRKLPVKAFNDDVFYVRSLV